MLILALDSSTSVGAVSLYEEEQLIAEYNLNLDLTHSQRLMPQIVNLMEDARLEVADLEGIVVGIGPGSFTGIRIGIATAKSLAQSLDIPIVGVSVLEVLANNQAYNKEYICPLIDARRERVYTAVYQGEDDFGLKRKLFSEQMMEVKDLIEELQKEFTGKIVFVGEGAKTYKGMLKEELKERAQFLAATHNLVRGGVLAKIGSVKFKQGKADELLEVTPNYLKRSQAEIDWEKKQRQRG